ncbi:sensor histidine kinase [Undibacterium parvum]|nr:HAMP domain-containing sensor histidine kinase [Undibacterium parvum]
MKNWISRLRSRWSLKFYLRIYLAMLASLVLAFVLMALIWQILLNSPRYFKLNMEHFSQIATDVLPASGVSKERQLVTLKRWGTWMDSDLSLYAPDGTLLNSTKSDAPARVPDNVKQGWFFGFPFSVIGHLSDQRWLLMQSNRVFFAPTLGQVLLALLVALALALGSYPIVRRLTKRLEHLQESVHALGQGALATRVAVEGDDEVAHLAMSFNQSAARIEALMAAQKSLLANASHELRSPLTRLRMAVELMQEQAAPAIRLELSRNINELDQLIEEILLSSRLEANMANPHTNEELDLTGLLAEECALTDALLTIQVQHGAAEGGALLQGDPKLLRRLLRNLLENAQRYGGTAAPEVLLLISPQQLQVDVCDRGAGIPLEQRERIFEAFYRVPGASESHGGVGLGLSLVRQIAQRHGGQVQCLAGEGGGSCFRVILPRAVRL